jgi:nitrate reductase alpha subunit
MDAVRAGHRRCDGHGDGPRHPVRVLVLVQTPFFVGYISKCTDLPFLVRLEKRADGYVTGKNLTAADLGDDTEGAAFKPVLIDSRTGEVVVPNGSLGFRYTDSGVGKWNLDLGDVVPQLTVLGDDAGTATLKLARFDTPDGHADELTRGVPVRRIGNELCCTVYDLMLAQYGVHRDGMPGDWPTGWDDPSRPYTPAWQESITGVSASQVVRVAQEFAHNAEESGGRSMIIMGAGICQWFHGDATYRAILAMLILTGSMGRNGGGWAHYVGQEKCRPITGWATRERSVLLLITDGLTNRQIGEKLFLAEKTVKNYVSALLAKLGMERRTQAAVYGAEIRR